MEAELITFIGVMLLPWILLYLSKNKINSIQTELDLTNEKLERSKIEIINQYNETITLREKYSKIIDIEIHSQQLLDEAEEEVISKKHEAERIVSMAEQVKLKAENQAAKIIDLANYNAEDITQEARSTRTEANQKLKESREKAENIKSEARNEADKIISFAKYQANEIAGNAYEAKEKADSYELAIRAMRNTIEGYKDDYIIPNHSVLDDLADEFSFKEAGDKLKAARKRVRDMVKEDQAGDCDYVELNRRTYAIHFAVDAFNGKVDSALSKVKYDNFGKIKQEIIDAYALVNHNGSPFRKARINQSFLDARLTELKWAVATFELKKIEKEEQAEIKAKIREEERVIREIEKARKEAEKEEKLLQSALEKARSELAHASDEQKAKYEAQLFELEEKLHEAEEKGKRALSMAQQTRRGHVYVISNIGSFGEDVFKIGMTRRLEPMDRIKELGDASVPFAFDVHAMIYSEDAPALEKVLHKKFDTQSVNKINSRKEFFRTSIPEIKQAVNQHGLNEVHWTLKAEAAEYRESLAIEKEMLSEIVA